MARKQSETGKPAKKSKISKAGAVELSEEQLDEAQGGIIIINGRHQKVQKVKKIQDLGSLSQKVFKI